MNSMRSIRIPGETDITTYPSNSILFPPFTEGFYILATGFPTGTAALNVATVSMCYVNEFTPTDTYVPICPS
jgi:hypothetical protein